MTDDITLLREYARCNSEEAFAALVSRHVNLVYSVALRDVQDPHLAEEITQAVFIILARKAESFDSRVVLGGWLCRTARYTSANALTIQRRRQQREQEAYVQSLLNESESTVWTQISPLLGGAMKQLGQKDHDAVVLRFFENKSFQEIGAVFGASENAAKKRVAYALEKMRKYFSKHGVTSTAAIIAGAISANSVQAAPVMLANTVTATAIAKGATASVSTSTLIKGALKIMAWTKAKTAIAVSVAAILAVGATTTLIVRHNHQAVAQTDFPRSSWNNAGYADPVSAFETMLWATSQSDEKTLFASLSPDLQRPLMEASTRAGISPEALLSRDKNRANHLDGITGFHVLQSEAISDIQVLLHLRMDGGQGEQTFKMKKTGNEWKMDGSPFGF